MNTLLQLKNRFESQKNTNFPRYPTLPKHAKVTGRHLNYLRENLIRIHHFWQNHTEIKGALVSVHYSRVIPKSSRIRQLLKGKSKNTNDTICGAKFSWNADHSKMVHVFTHFVSLDTIENSIQVLQKAEEYIVQRYGGIITDVICETIAKESKRNTQSYNGLSKSVLLGIIVDSFYVDRFDIDRSQDRTQGDTLVTIFRTGENISVLLQKYGISIDSDRIINGTTLRLFPDEMQRLLTQAPYLISMSVTDMTEVELEDLGQLPHEGVDGLIPDPSNEPIIGVIDTPCNENVYFHKWVTYQLDDDVIGEEPLNALEYQHGTAVTSIIVDGPRGNPKLNDHCGRFRVRHFGILVHGKISSFSLIQKIREIVATNTDIKVWNLSMGSKSEIQPNFISPGAAALDQIQNEYDVIFVVAGTNKTANDGKDEKKVGEPADSINSIVVNSVTFDNKPASYTRVGPVLSFFNKPDLSYYGGDTTEGIIVCRDDLGAVSNAGTSFAAPWITRKLAYLIYIMGFTRETAKALLIDSASGWNATARVSHEIGFGVVPIDIRDILTTKDDEIRFVIQGATRQYDTFNYNLPIPVENQAHPFYARVTLVYFPTCNWERGVDYTNTEMDIHFGRVIIEKGKSKIKDLQKNKQGDDTSQKIYEEDARKTYRKWDNVKHICEEIKSRHVPRKAYSSGLWGIDIKTKDRGFSTNNSELPFGLVVTLKEMNGKNRYGDFIKLCQARGWIVNEIDVENRMEVYEQAEEDIEWK